MTIRFTERDLFVDGKTFHMSHPIEDAIEYGDTVVILLDPDSHTGEPGPYHNLIAINRSGLRKWDAELPENGSIGRYYEIASKQPLIANSMASFACEIELKTGRILRKTFTK